MPQDETLTFDPRVLLERKSFITPDDLARSDLDALYVGNSTRYSNIAKLTIQKFMEACLRENGQFYPFFKWAASFAGNFVINENLSKDDRRRHLQIARLFEKTAERPPQILISDGSVTYKPASLGGLTAGWNDRSPDGRQVLRIMDSVEMPLEITCAALDETTIDDLQGFIYAAFGSNQRLLTNWVLKPSRQIDGAYWELILPQLFEVGSKNRTLFHGDTQHSIYSFSTTINATFENSTYIQYSSAPIFDLATRQFEITIPSKITLSSTVPIYLKNMPGDVYIYSTNPSVALIKSQHTLNFIVPKKIGKFTLVVAKPLAEGEETMLIYGQKELEVALR